MAERRISGTLKIWNRGEPGFVPEGTLDVEPRTEETGWKCSFEIVRGSLMIVRWEPEPDVGIRNEIEELRGEIRKQVENSQKNGVAGQYDWKLCVLDERCLRCEAILFKVVPLPPDGRCWAMSDEMPLDLKSDDDDKFYECQHCGAKNVIASRGRKGGEQALQCEIVSWKE